MNSYSIWLSVHVVTAILGLGQIVGTTIVASSTPTNAPIPPGTLTAFRRLGRGTGVALAIMLISGGLLERSSGGAFHGMLWFRASLLLLLVLGALQGLIRRTLRKAARERDGRRVRGVVRLSGAMCAVVATIAILMETKPSMARPEAHAATETAPPEAFARCSTCHGPRGHGDGALAKSLAPRPPDFRDPRWQERASDDELRDVILRGGPARGRSALMPAHADLSPSELEAIVRFIRAESGAGAAIEARP